jgi:hypothetical protein
MLKSAALLLVLAGLVAAAVFLPERHDQQQLQRTSGTPPSGAAESRAGAGRHAGQGLEHEPAGTRGSALLNPFQTGRSWSTGSATSSGEVVYLDPASEVFQTAARKVRAEQEEMAAESTMQLIQPAPPDAAAAF